MTDRFWNKTTITREEYQELLRKKRETIKNAPEYYGTGAPSSKKDYIYYKKLLQSKLEKNERNKI